ncbi:uncharacterized protein LOC108098401 isoform X2 [Drosophila ficusphila]|uniref:uncharacterized protein LOC108098401 isoform X2 n=1 Tax=Drosophila ficusphila TaxID=30025 RepID=UPI0007E7CCFE|nr:uncharacterized protein LOC108098401 isoform X2 [Drosophila ficusphila]
MNCTEEKERCFCPSDLLNQNTRQMLLELSTQLWQKKNEPTHSSKTVDLRKIFTPATDAPEILPKNRKLYSSSAFYSPTLHPTVEDQVELARRISHSLSDISNQTSKGQSMYVNRKKRSDKWVHEGRSQGNECLNDAINQLKENSDTKSTLECKKLEKIPLRLLMNPNGKVHDYNSLKELINTKTGLLSPDNCAELITALQLQQGKGAELFAKRRKKAENWVVDEANTGTLNHPSGIPDYQQYQQKPAISPNILPAYSDAGKHRVQLNIHQNQLIEKYAKPGVQVVVSPWEAALQTGSASSAFLENTKSQCDPPSAVAPPLYFPGGNKDFTDAEEPRRSHDLKQYNKASGSQAADVLSNPQRDLAYTPCVAQGWGGRSVELPKGLYVPKEISLSSYAAPSNQYAVQEKRVEAPRYESSPHPFPKTNFPGESSYGTINNTAFPASKPLATGYTTLPPQRQLYSPSSYQKSQVGSENFKPQVNFNPSPLSFDKLARYEQPDKGCSVGGGPQYLNAQQNLHVGNASPVPFDVGYNKVTSTSPSSIGSMGSSNRNLSRTDYFRSGPAPSSLVTRPTSHDQSFNKCARGWGTLPGQQQNYQSQHSYPSAGNLPYSDF